MITIDTYQNVTDACPSSAITCLCLPLMSCLLC